MSAHSTALIDKKLYFIGGHDPTADTDTSFFYLDLNQSFNTSSPAFVNLSTLPVGITFAAACVGGSNDDEIFIFGGANQDKIISFNTKSQEWFSLITEGEPIRRRDMQAVIDNKGNIYMFGGYNEFNNTLTFFRDMIIFNILTYTYSNEKIYNNPPNICGYTATLLQNGSIVYIGGIIRKELLVQIEFITIYDINKDSWNYITATRFINSSYIEDRYYHSAVLTHDGRIICYGGIAESLSTVSRSLIVLNTTSFEWNSPDNFGTNKPPRLYLHSANLVENYMIIGFGNVTSENTSSRIYQLNIRNYTWIAYYEVPVPGINIINQPKPPTFSVVAVVGITIGVAIVLVLLLFFGIRFYRRASLSFSSGAVEF
ncbi:hypothetical protein Glove_114g198 [Diversispora epigaea]|uniref:Attractin/MKLN-like beta-propeller domain-containing protein n=1 Tax=Diversispora epigaea TaxID=1348612 RepID=A0A397JA95_9GLOM|nr:hypothetical protein Glove_114g198 [Diversispora epigaea]